MKRIKTVCLILSLSYLPIHINTTYSAETNLVASKEKIAKWIELKKTTAEEKLVWDEQKTIIQDRINILKIEEQALSEHLQALNEKQNLSESRRQLLLEQKKALTEQSNTLRGNLQSAIHKIKQIYPRLPHSLQKQITTINESPLSTLSDIQATEMTVEALNAIEVFANQTTVAQEIRSLLLAEPEAGTEKQKNMLVNVIFLGLGSAYYLSEDGEHAGIGFPSEDKWIWQPEPSIKERLANALKIANGKVAPSLVALPIRIGEGQ